MNRVFVGALLLGLTGCGFHPLYAPSGQTQVGLSEIFVDVIPNRTGQLLRQALQERFDGANDAPARRYVLDVQYVENVESIGIQADSSSSRNRYIGTVHWTLKKPGFLGQKITSGIARALDGNDVIVAQFFYSDLNGEAINRRMSEALADQVAESLASYFRAHPNLV